MNPRWVALILAVLVCAEPVSQTGVPRVVETFSVRDEPVAQVLMAFAEESGISIVTDETVDGEISIVLHQRDAMAVVLEIAEAARLFAVQDGNTVHLSRLRVARHGVDGWTLGASGATLEAVLRGLSRQSGRSILPPELPRERVDLQLGPLPLESLLTALGETWGLELHRRGQAFYYTREGALSPDLPGPPSPGILELRQSEAAWHITARRTSRGAILEELFQRDGSVFSFAAAAGDAATLNTPVERLELQAETLRELRNRTLRHLDLAAIPDGLSWIVFPLGQEARLPAYTSRGVVTLRRTPLNEVLEALARLPAIRVEAGSSGRNVVVIRGLPDALADALELVELLEGAPAGRQPLILRVERAAPEWVAQALAARYSDLSFSPVGDRPEVMVVAPVDLHDELRQTAADLDTPEEAVLYRARHLPAQELAAVMNRSGVAAQLIPGSDTQDLVIDGSRWQIRQAIALARLLDTPPEQLRFDLCIIQYQSSFSSHRGSAASLNRDSSSADIFETTLGVAAEFDRLLSLQFDLLSALGYRAALAISGELGSNNARLVADTSIRAGNGVAARLENATTYRYRDLPEQQDSTKTVAGVVREIDSGLTVELQGWMHRDRTITVNVTVSVSKQGTDLSGRGNPPPTSRRVVETSLRVAAGEPIVIGGLLQQESSRAEQRIPLLGRIPILRQLLGSASRTDEETEMVLYLSVFPDRPEHPHERQERQIHTLRGMLPEVPR